MDDFRRTFLADSIKNLEVLRENLNDNPAENRRQAFRTIHTVKGGLQTFGWQNAARFAAQIEDILSVDSDFPDRNLLIESIAQLGEMMRSDETELSAELLAKLHAAQPKKIEYKVAVTRIPSGTYKKLSPSEQKTMRSAVSQEKNIFSAEVAFKTATFAADYRNLRQILEQKSEIIAALPSEKFRDAGEIGFQIFLAAAANIEELQKLTENLSNKIILRDYLRTAKNDWLEMLTSLESYGENIASAARKKINFSIFSSEHEVSGASVKNFFDILIHLIRNAVDHAVVKTGNIEIQITKKADGWHISFADDGRGVDLEKLRARAIEKKLISAADILDERQTLELIFASELSTAEQVTETSGRGVGLDAVKNTVEKLNGEISVTTGESGTTFKIFLPNEC